MDDRELLDMAAKAAGMMVVSGDWDNHQTLYHCAEGSFTSGLKFWNPLTDDGDALRLATALDIDIYHQATKAIAGRVMRMTEYFGGNKQIAVRRAIVRAAAEIGRAMK